MSMKVVLTELKSLASPPRDVVNTMVAACILVDPKLPREHARDDWSWTKKCLAQPTFLTALTHKDPSKVTPEQAKAAQELVTGLSVELVRNMSFAAGELFKWVQKTLQQCGENKG